MYYDMNPSRRVNEWIDNVYRELIMWIEANGEQGIKNHIEQIMRQRQKHREVWNEND